MKRKNNSFFFYKTKSRYSISIQTLLCFGWELNFFWRETLFHHLLSKLNIKYHYMCKVMFLSWTISNIVCLPRSDLQEKRCLFEFVFSSKTIILLFLINSQFHGNNVSYSKVFCILEEKQEFHTNILYLPMSNTSRSGLDKLPFCWKWPWVFLILIFVMPNDVYLYSRLNLCILQWFHYSANYSACSVSKIIFIVFLSYIWMSFDH